MKVRLEVLSAKEWEAFAEDAHKAVFDERLPPNFLRIDYAVLGIDADSNDPVMYATCREIDADSVYWQYGGAIDKIRRTDAVSRIYKLFIGFCRDSGYKTITSLVDSDNVKYLRLAMANGFRIIGCRNWEYRTYVELCLRFNDTVQKQGTNALQACQ